MQQKIQHKSGPEKPRSTSSMGIVPTDEESDKVLSHVADNQETDCREKPAGSSEGTEISVEKGGFSKKILTFFTPAGFLLAIISIYQKLISPLKPPCCRFSPTCSDYAREAIQVHGVVKGVLLSVWRILRCQPFCKGGYDPVPELKKKMTTPGNNSSRRYGIIRITL